MRLRLITLLCCLPTLALAEGPWSGDVAVGFLSTSGNSSSTSLNAKTEAVYSVTRYKNTFTATALNGEQEQVRTAERYTVGNKLDYNFDENNYAFLALDAEKDLYGGVRERTTETVGYGRSILTGPVHKLDAEIGAGARQTLAQGATERENDAIARLSGRYEWKISDTSTFLQSLKVESGDENTFTESISELKLNIVGNIFAGISFTVRNNSDVPVGTEQTDTATAVNLSYQFGKS